MGFYPYILYNIDIRAVISLSGRLIIYISQLTNKWRSKFSPEFFLQLYHSCGQFPYAKLEI